MCFHRRTLFTCNHHAWGALTEPCDVEKAFERGERDKGCDVRWSHGFETVRVQMKCAECAMTQAAQEYRFGVVKEQIKVLNEYLQMIKGIEENEGQEGNPDGKGEKKEEDAKGEGDDPMSSLDAFASSSSSSIDGDSEDTGDTSVNEGGCEGCDETMEEVRVDPDHRPLKLPQIVAERKARGI